MVAGKDVFVAGAGETLSSQSERFTGNVGALHFCQCRPTVHYMYLNLIALPGGNFSLLPRRAYMEALESLIPTESNDGRVGQCYGGLRG